MNKRRRGFFTKPTEKEIKQAQETSQQSADQAGNNGDTAAKGKPSEAADKGSAGNVFRNVIHELRDRNLPVEMHYAHTEDQFWIPVVRIPAKGVYARAAGQLIQASVLTNSSWECTNNMVSPLCLQCHVAVTVMLLSLSAGALS